MRARRGRRGTSRVAHGRRRLPRARRQPPARLRPRRRGRAIRHAVAAARGGRDWCWSPWAESGRRTRWVTLAIAADRHLAEPLFAALPPVLKVGCAPRAPLAWPCRFARVLAVRHRRAAPRGHGRALAGGRSWCSSRALRRHVGEDLADEVSGWLAGLKRPPTSAPHSPSCTAGPGEHWTVEEQPGESRSGVALRRWRSASRWSRASPSSGSSTRVRVGARGAPSITAHSIETIAEGAGYEAVSSFSRAFKRAYGKPPSVRRRKSRRRRVRGRSTSTPS